MHIAIRKINDKYYDHCLLTYERVKNKFYLTKNKFYLTKDKCLDNLIKKIQAVKNDLIDLHTQSTTNLM